MDQSQPRDVAARLSASRENGELRPSGDEFRLLVEAVTEYAIYRLDPEGHVVSWNAGAERIKGYAKEEILGRHFSAFYTAEAVEAGMPEEGLEKAARDGQWTHEGWRVRKDGERFWAHVTVTALRGNDGQLRGFVKVTRDMTKRREREEALRESEAKFRVLAEKALIGVALYQGGVYKYVNPAFARMVGYQPAELIGQSPEILFHAGDWPLVQQQMKKRFAGKVEESHYEARVLTKSEQVRTLEILGSRIVYRDEPALIATAMDITERRQLQRDVLRTQEEERRRLGQDLHDGVASQLTGVAILLGTLAKRSAAEGGDLTGDIREAQELVQESSQDVRRLSRGLAPAGLSSKELPSALERLTENVEGGRFEKGDDLPELESDAAAHLYWIAQEAITNARKYAEAGEIAIHLTSGESGALTLEIEDEGRGFDVAGVGHEGLGLRTMRYRAEILGAAFTIDSSPGEGTRVRCRLPVSK